MAKQATVVNSNGMAKFQKQDGYLHAMKRRLSSLPIDVAMLAG